MGNAISRTDAGFGPLLEGKVYFTQLFEESVFTTVPAIVAILAALIQVYCVVGEPMLVRSGHLFVSKLVAGSTLVGCHIATLVLWAVLSTVRTEMTLPAAALAAIGSLFIVLFLHVEHFYSYRPSTFLSLFMSVTLLLDIAKTYSCFYRVGLGALFAMYTLSCITRFWLLISQEVSKRQLIRLESLRLSVGQEAASGFWTRSLFLWLNSTLLLGFRQALKVEDLPPLAPEFRANTLYAAFKLQWNRVNKRSRYALVKACILTQAVQFITITIPRLCLIGFTFAQPFLLLRTTTAVGEEDLPESTIDGLLGATALVYFGIAITKGYYTHLAYQVTVCIRGMLTVAIYDKMLRLSHEVLLESAAVTLMSTDLSGLERLVPLFHDMWAAVIELGLGLAILGKIAGPSCVLFLVPGIITTGGSSIVTKKMISARTAWNEKIQDRVAKTSNIIAQLKIIKMAGLSEPMLAFIEKLRATELKTSMRERNLRVIVGALNAFNRALAPVIVLAAAMFWTQAGDRLTSSEIYTILAVVAIISQPLATILLAIPALSGALASFPRIQNFLTQEEQVDSRSVNDDYTSVRAAGVSVNSDYSRPILQEINLQFTQGTVAMLTGPVGCGKTTLLKTLIGEVQLQAGSIEIRSCPIGYSDQVAWLENVSIRDNVCHDDYNATWYRKVLTACCLDPDLAALPLGDQTIVGTNGSNISGGQRQRVALARAVYCQAPLLVLDDPLSAVDATTASAIVERLLGNSGLLRNRNVTVLMTTSSRDLCSVADTVFSMNAEGKVQRLPGLARDAKRSHGPRQLVSAQQDGQEDLGEKANLPNDDIGDTVGDTVPNSALYSCAPIEEDRDEIRKGDRTLYAYYMGSVKLPLLILSLCLIALSSIADRLPAIFLRVWLDVDPENDEYFIGYAGLAVFKIVIASLSLYLFFRNIFVGTSTVLHRRLLTATMGTTLSFLAETDPGTMLSRFSQDMSLIAQVLPINFLNSVYMIVTVTMEVAIICAGARYTASIIPALLIIVYLVQFFYLRTSRQLRVRELEAKEPLFTKFAETASGIQHIRAFRWQEAFMLQTQELLDRSQIPYYNLFCVQRWLTLVLDLTVCAIATTLVGLATGYRSLTDENAVGLSMLSLVTFSGSLTELVKAWVDLEISLGAIARVKAFCFGAPQEAKEDGEYNTDIPDNWPSSGRVEFRDVSARYRKLDGSSHLVLNSISFTIGNGRKLGLTGRTGSGKSSILAVLLRMIDYSGSVRIDGLELRTIPREVIRTRFITLAQDGLQLQGSVRLNLDPYNPLECESSRDGASRLSDQALEQALTRVGLWEGIRNFGGLDLDMGAANFSQGQLQLFGIARAILRKSYSFSKIVLIDEATSSIDNDKDREMQAMIGDAFANCTVLMVSHRLYAFDRMHKVLMLNDGQIEDTLKRDPGSGLLVEA